MAKEETVKKRGAHERQRLHPGVKGRRPDKAAKRRVEAAARQAAAPPKPEWAHPDDPAAR